MNNNFNKRKLNISQGRKNNSSGLMLTELIIAILFFSIVSASCLQIFTKSHVLERKAMFNRSSVNIVNSICGIIDSAADNIEITDVEKLTGYFTEYFSKAEYSDGIIRFYIDENDQCVSEDDDPVYMVYVIPVKNSNNMEEFTIGLQDLGDETGCYEVSYTVFLQNNRR